MLCGRDHGLAACSRVFSQVGIGAATDIRLVRLATATVLSSSHVPGRPQDSLKRGPTINGRAV